MNIGCCNRPSAPRRRPPLCSKRATDSSPARIDATLGDDEDGILFIGALHKVAKFLPQRIKVEYLAVRGQ